jgi:hypothetical protein
LCGQKDQIPLSAFTFSLTLFAYHYCSSHFLQCQNQNQTPFLLNQQPINPTHPTPNAGNPSKPPQLQTIKHKSSKHTHNQTQVNVETHLHYLFHTHTAAKNREI